MRAIILVALVPLSSGCTVLFSGTTAMVVAVHNTVVTPDSPPPPPKPPPPLEFCSRSLGGTARFCTAAREECEGRVNHLRSLGGEFEACKSNGDDHADPTPPREWSWRAVGYAALIGLVIDLTVVAVVVGQCKNPCIGGD